MYYCAQKRTPALFLILCCLFVAGTPTVSHAGFMVGWDFNGLTDYGASPLTAGTATGDVTVGGLTRGSGVATSGTAAGDAWGGNGWVETGLGDAIAANDFATFSITGDVSGPPALRYTEIAAYNIRRSNAGPTTGQWQYQIGGGSFNNIGSAITWGGTTTVTGNLQSSIDLSDISVLQNVSGGQTVTFRLVNWGASSAVGTWYFNDFQTGNDLVISGQAIPEPSSLVLAGMAGSCGWYAQRRAKKKRMSSRQR